ncbi:RfaG Glycosyltransferase [Candidatus Nanopelagicaceae bacterium]
MKILFLTVGYPPEQTGGAEAQARLQALELKKQGHDVLILTRSEQFKLRRELIEGVSTIRLPHLQVRIVGTLFHLSNVFISLCLLRRKYDLIHVHLANLNADTAVLAGKCLRKPVYVKLASGGESGEIFRFRKLSKITRFFGLRHADRVQTISSEIYGEAENLGIKPTSLVKIPNGVLTENYLDIEKSREISSNNLRLELGLSADSFIFLYLGRIATYKGIDDLLTAWDLCKFSSETTLLLVGPTALDRPYKIVKTDKNILELGNQLDTSRFLLGSNCFVLPSHGEGMSNALLEAMSSKLPIISTSVGASNEVLNFGAGGRLVPPKQPKLLAEAMRSALTNAEENRLLSEFSYKEVQLKYEIGRVSREIVSTYKEMLR